MKEETIYGCPMVDTYDHSEIQCVDDLSELLDRLLSIHRKAFTWFQFSLALFINNLKSTTIY